MDKWVKWSEIKRKWLKDPQVLKEYKALKLEFQIASQLIELRTKKGLTQFQLAKKVGTHQSAIARLESGDANPSVKLLERIAQATGSKLTIKLN